MPTYYDDIEEEDRHAPTDVEDCVVIHTTDLALLVRTPDGDEEWIPKSQIDPYSDLTKDSEKGDIGTLVIPRWLAEEKCLA